MAQNDFIGRLLRINRSPAFGWLCLAIALIALLMTPVATYSLWKTGLRGWALCGAIAIALPFRFLWIGLFFNRWLASRKLSDASERKL